MKNKLEKNIFKKWVPIYGLENKHFDLQKTTLSELYFAEILIEVSEFSQAKGQYIDNKILRLRGDVYFLGFVRDEKYEYCIEKFIYDNPDHARDTPFFTSDNSDLLINFVKNYYHYLSFEADSKSDEKINLLHYHINNGWALVDILAEPGSLSVDYVY